MKEWFLHYPALTPSKFSCTISLLELSLPVLLYIFMILKMDHILIQEDSETNKILMQEESTTKNNKFTRIVTQINDIGLEST